MPSKITNFLHDSFVVANPVPSLGTTFSTADVHVHDMTLGLPQYQRNGQFSGIVEGIHVRLQNVAGAPTKIFLKVCLDANLDIAVVPETEALLTVGTTTTTDACAAMRVGIPVFQVLGGTTLYLAARLDAGTADYTASCITWRE